MGQSVRALGVVGNGDLLFGRNGPDRVNSQGRPEHVADISVAYIDDGVGTAAVILERG